MKEIIAYKCESCGNIYSNKESIKTCNGCGKDICDECSSFNDETCCWDCDKTEDED